MKKGYTDWERVPLICEVDTVALILQCNEETVKRNCRSGKLKAFKVGSVWKIEKSALMEFCGIQKIA